MGRRPTASRWRRRRRRPDNQPATTENQRPTLSPLYFLRGEAEDEFLDSRLGIPWIGGRKMWIDPTPTLIKMDHHPRDRRRRRAFVGGALEFRRTNKLGRRGREKKRKGGKLCGGGFKEEEEEEGGKNSLLLFFRIFFSFLQGFLCFSLGSPAEWVGGWIGAGGAPDGEKKGQGWFFSSLSFSAARKNCATDVCPKNEPINLFNPDPRIE